MTSQKSGIDEVASPDIDGGTVVVAANLAHAETFLRSQQCGSWDVGDVMLTAGSHIVRLTQALTWEETQGDKLN